ncbi:response regulator [uncultured Sphingomonas sp.]|jgi:DNA-binding response OmpR family regulator|uniref:response regulator n=1 Tax=uncultured Sphingomonas sp. TaxID=158754 RepID=UPI002619BF4E|nr:response regulator [uncultured Sphingomonas sp.]
MFGRGKQDKVNETRRILVVEDEPLIAFDTEHLLSEAGYEVVATVDNAAEALRLIAAGGIDLVTADVNLRGEGSGIDIARAAREAGLAVLFVSGQCPVEAQSLAHGCLAKPHSPRDLLAAIAAVAVVRAGGKPSRVPRGLTLYGG